VRDTCFCAPFQTDSEGGSKRRIRSSIMPAVRSPNWAGKVPVKSDTDWIKLVSIS